MAESSLAAISEEQAVRALIDLSRVRDDRIPDDENAPAREFLDTHPTWPTRDPRRVGDQAFEVREVASLAGDLQRNDVASLREWPGAKGTDREVSSKAQARIAELVERYTADVVSKFVPIEGTRAFTRRRVPRTLLAAAYLQLESRIIQGKRLHVCDRKPCHAIFLRDDERSQTYCSDECERKAYYRENIDTIKAKRRATAAARAKARKGRRS